MIGRDTLQSKSLQSYCLLVSATLHRFAYSHYSLLVINRSVYLLFSCSTLLPFSCCILVALLVHSLGNSASNNSLSVFSLNNSFNSIPHWVYVSLHPHRSRVSHFSNSVDPSSCQSSILAVSSLWRNRRKRRRCTSSDAQRQRQGREGMVDCGITVAYHVLIFSPLTIL